MDQPTSARRRKLPRKQAALVIIILLVVAVFGVDLISRPLFAPWSIGVLGRDTLTGDWVGTARAQQGAEFGLHLRLNYESNTASDGNSYGRNPNLRGNATLCTQTGERYEYRVTGIAKRSGTVEELWVEYGDPSLSALNLRLSGKWDAPVLRLTASANPFMPDGSFIPQRVVSSADPDNSLAPFEMEKGGLSDLDPICQRISQ